MVIPPTAPCLPEGIVREIARHLPVFRHFPPSLYAKMELEHPVAQWEYVPLLHVCQAWRHAVCPLFYRNVFCGQKEQAAANFEKAGDFLYLQDVFENGFLRCIRTMTISVTLSSLHKPDVDSDTVASLLRTCGPLEQVRRVCIIFTQDTPDTSADRIMRSKGLDLDTEPHPSTVAMSGKEFAGCIRTALPGLRRIDMGFWPSNGLPRGYTGEFGQVLLGLDGLIGHSLASPSEWQRLGALYFSYSHATSLQSIVVTASSDSRGHIELIRRCAESLEQLIVDDYSAQAVAEIFVDGSSAVVYPYLKGLTIDTIADSISLAEQRLVTESNAILKRLEVDPYPQLAVLDLYGPFLSLYLAVLGLVRLHIRCLSIGFNASAASLFLESSFIRPGFFSCLQRFSFVPEGTQVGYDHARQFIKVPAISNALRTIVIPFSEQMSDQDISTMWFPDTLRCLDIHWSGMTLRQVVSILSKCPRLEWAYVTLKDTNGLHSVLAEDCRNRYTLGTRGVLSIVVGSSLTVHPELAYKLVVLLADAVTSLVRVDVKPQRTGSANSQFQDHIRNECQNSVYEGRNPLDRVRFCLDEEI